MGGQVGSDLLVLASRSESKEKAVGMAAGGAGAEGLDPRRPLAAKQVDIVPLSLLQRP